MLEDVEDARIVCRRRLESDGERTVGVIAGKPEQACPAGHMPHLVRVAGELVELMDRYDLEFAMDAADGEVGTGLREGIRCF